VKKQFQAGSTAQLYLPAHFFHAKPSLPACFPLFACRTVARLPHFFSIATKSFWDILFGFINENLTYSDKLPLQYFTKESLAENPLG
jgi:hypothetical protein